MFRGHHHESLPFIFEVLFCMWSPTGQGALLGESPPGQGCLPGTGSGPVGPTPNPRAPAALRVLPQLEESAQARWCETPSGPRQGRVLTVGTIKETGE